MQWARQKQAGFTIVELLIVVVVIAILAAIAIVSYTGIQNRTHDTTVQNDLANIAKQYEMYKVRSAASIYPYGADLNDGVAFKMNITKNSYDPNAAYQLLNCTSSASQGSNYAVLAVSKSGKKFYVSSEGGVKEYTGASGWLVTGNCPELLSGSTANGAGYSTAGWRAWTSAN